MSNYKSFIIKLIRPEQRKGKDLHINTRPAVFTDAISSEIPVGDIQPESNLARGYLLLQEYSLMNNFAGNDHQKDHDQVALKY